MLDARSYLALTLDPVRLAILGRAAEGPVDPDDVANALGIRPRDALEAIGRLRAAGLLGNDGTLDRDVLRSVAASLPQQPPPDPAVTGPGMWSGEEADVLGRFFSGKRLTSIPANQAKRRVVLERLAQEFEPGIRYEEAAVNFALQLWHSDYAALRRYLVDEGFLTRAEGVYWRTGGRYGSEMAAPD
jgi:hypothetical protein